MKTFILLVTVSLLPLAARAECQSSGLAGVLDINATACAAEPTRSPAGTFDPQNLPAKQETAGDIAGLNDDPIYKR